MLFRYKTRQLRRRKVLKRWVVWGIASAMIPAVALGAYQPAVLLVANNLSDLASASTARTNLGLGTAATKAASGAGSTVASVTGSFTSGHMATFSDTAGTIQDGGVAPAAPTLSTFTSTLPTTLSSTDMVTTVSSMATPAAGVYNLPTAAAGLRSCLKDGTTNFGTNNATVKATGTIDGVAGSTGIILNQQHQELCFISDGTNWFVE